jgi:hypothetical protein
MLQPPVVKLNLTSNNWVESFVKLYQPHVKLDDTPVK